jgi:hypothetical protein
MTGSPAGLAFGGDAAMLGRRNPALRQDRQPRGVLCFVWGFQRLLDGGPAGLSTLTVLCAVSVSTGIAIAEDRTERGAPCGAQARVAAVVALAVVIGMLFVFGPSGYWMTVVLLICGPVLVLAVPLTYRRLKLRTLDRKL